MAKEGDTNPCFQPVESVAIKLPPFWTKNPDAWLAKVEAQFKLRNITVDDTKFNHVVAALEESVAERVLHIINLPDTQQDRYKQLKNELVRKYGLSDEQRAHRILEMEGLGDRKPSELLYDMLSVIGDRDVKFLLRHIFLRQLPEPIRLALANDTSELEELAPKADKLWNNQDLRANAMVEEDPDEINATKRWFAQKKKTTLCFYHEFFGRKAKKCQPPCVFSKNVKPDRA